MPSPRPSPRGHHDPLANLPRPLSERQAAVERGASSASGWSPCSSSLPWSSSAPASGRVTGRRPGRGALDPPAAATPSPAPVGAVVERPSHRRRVPRPHRPRLRSRRRSHRHARGLPVAAAARPPDPAVRAVAVGLADRRRRAVPRRDRPRHVLRRPDRRRARRHGPGGRSPVRPAHGLGRRPQALPRSARRARSCGGRCPIVVVIDDGNGYRSIYAHFGKVDVKKGQVVKAGQLLG